MIQLYETHLLFILLADIYNKYDTIVYPPYPTKTFFESLKVWKSSPDDFKPLDSVEMRQKCLLHFLKPFATKICSGELLPNYNIILLSKQILDIYSQMRLMTIHRSGVHYQVTKNGVIKVIH